MSNVTKFHVRSAMTNKDERPEQATSSVHVAGSTKTESFLLKSLRALRRLVEKILRKKVVNLPKEQDALSSEEARKIIHELQLHHIQLEAQNEELQRTQVELKLSRVRYFNLYDLAPVGYCTINENGLILEANLTAANLLGVVRELLTNQPVSRFIHKEDQDVYYLLRKQLFETGEPQSGELRLVCQDGTSFWANLETSIGLDDSGLTVNRVVLNNITNRKRAEEVSFANIRTFGNN